MNKKGFTLVELIAVITILSIILIITIPIILKSRENAAKGLNKEEIANIKQTGKSIGIDLDDYNTDIYNCKSGSWLRNRCIKENGIWKKVTVSLDELREHGYLSDITSKWSGLVIIENKTDTDEGYLVTLEENSSLDGVTQANIYEVTFDPNGGVLTGDNKKELLENEVYGELPIPTRKGYSFEGWYTSQEGGNKVSRKDIINNSNQTLYAHWESECKIVYPVTNSFAEKLINQANNVNVTNYNSGTKTEMYTFLQPETEQTCALTDYRYIGNTPNNYVTFNNEIWRIIGVFTVEDENGNKTQNVKIIMDKSLGNMSWDKKSDGTSIDDWSTSTLGTMLNSDYLNSANSFNYTWYDYIGTAKTVTIMGLTSLAKSQISSVKWYLGSNSTALISAKDNYLRERYKKNDFDKSTNWIGKVGLIYISDYLYTYALGVDNTCYNNGSDCQTDKGGIPSIGWLYSSSWYWSIIPASGENSVSVVSNKGLGFSAKDSNFDVRPVVYLRPDIRIIGGDGSSGNPYVLGVLGS